ncbi:MAG: Spy/CpxP family protein refolding chaperone [Pseudanabaenaceae cyanobacterium bins.68]|nr:Spy/CpxP family protein refolding chaperone [Pseudanabaenaceae cyanobacterium bins.68]
MKNLTLRAIALAALLSTGIAILPSQFTTAQEPPGIEVPDRRGERIWQQLNLTPEQTQQIKAIKEQNQEARKAQWQQMRQLGQELRTMLAGDTPRFQITAKFDQVQALRQQIARDRFEQTLKMRDVLTSAQRQKLDELIQAKRGMWRDRFGSK